MKTSYKAHELPDAYKEYLDNTKAALEIAKLRQEIEALKNQNSDYKGTKIRANLAILFSAFLVLKEIVQLLITKEQ